jgi:hypothetical protein
VSNLKKKKVQQKKTLSWFCVFFGSVVCEGKRAKKEIPAGTSKR